MPDFQRQISSELLSRLSTSKPAHRHAVRHFGLKCIPFLRFFCLFVLIQLPKFVSACVELCSYCAMFCSSSLKVGALYFSRYISLEGYDVFENSLMYSAPSVEATAVAL